jgi:hypothetical protein
MHEDPEKTPTNQAGSKRSLEKPLWDQMPTIEEF